MIPRVLRAIEALAEEPLPHGVKKLIGTEKMFRIRVGDYRVIYEVLSYKNKIQIERIRHRKDAYR